MMPKRKNTPLIEAVAKFQKAVVKRQLRISAQSSHWSNVEPLPRSSTEPAVRTLRSNLFPTKVCAGLAEL